MKENSSPPSPALAAGLRLLECLRDGEPRRLEELSEELQLARASALRHLRTLEELGYAEQGTDRRWIGLGSWQAREGDAERRERLKRKLMQAALASGASVEWYKGNQEGMHLELQERSETESRLIARPGFCRVWSAELDAVALLGYAFDPAAASPDVGSFEAYQEHASLAPLPREEALQRIQLAREQGSAIDPAFNAHGIRRSAIAIHDGDHYLGVLAIAETWKFHLTPKAEERLRFLQSLHP